MECQYYRAAMKLLLNIDCNLKNQDMMPIIDLLKKSKDKNAKWILSVIEKNSTGLSVREMFEQEKKDNNLSTFVLNNMKDKKKEEVLLL
jgi:hypothetical protein